MKKLLVLCLMALFVGCNQPVDRKSNSNEVKNNEKPDEVAMEMDNDVIEPDDVDTSQPNPPKEGYYLEEGWLKHNGMLKFNYFDSIPMTADEKMDVGFSEWFRREDDKNLYIYLEGAAGCGGCFWHDEYYIEILKDSGSAHMKTLSKVDANGEEVNWFMRGVETLFSPDKTKFIVLEDRYFPVSEIEGKTVKYAHVYNLLTNKIEKTYSYPEEQYLVDCGIMYCEVSEKAVKWNESNQTFDFEPMDEMGAVEEGKERRSK